MDGHALRYCLSVSQLDGAGAAPVGPAGWTGVSHLFGTFNAAKEKIVLLTMLVYSEVSA